MGTCLELNYITTITNLSMNAFRITEFAQRRKEAPSVSHEEASLFSMTVAVVVSEPFT